jgi:hypothetical protein
MDMKVSHYECRNCKACFAAAPNRRTQWLAAGVAAAFGGAVTRSILWSVAFGGVGYWAAGKVQTVMARRCPNCHQVADPIFETLRSPLEAEERAVRAA